MNNIELAKRISAYLNTQSDIIPKVDFIKEMKKIYTELEKGKSTKSNDETDKKKREPSKYNIFMRSEMAVLKAKIQSGEEKEMSNREMMTYISKIWQEKKEEVVKVEEKKEEVVKVEEKKEEVKDVKVEDKKLKKGK
jgi:hypothetical protein